MRIQHNIMAMNAYRNYTNNTSALKSNLEKLSSGYKINRAGDDAAGLAISEKMRAQITGLETAQKNAKDGISLVQTAEGAMTEVHSMLNRMVELAGQSANGTYDNEVDRANLQKEITALKGEIDRIADSANFNGIKLLDGSMEATTTVTAATDLNLGTKLDGKLAAKAQAGEFKIDLSQLQITANSTASSNGNAVTFTIGGATVTNANGTAVALSKVLQKGTPLTGKELADKFNGNIVTLNGVKYDITANNGVLTLKGQNPPAKASTAGLVLDVNVSAAKGTSNQGDEFAVTVVQKPVAQDARVYAQASASMTAGQITDGTTLKIGDTTYTFAVGKNSAFKDAANVVDLTDMKDNTVAGFLPAALSRLTKVADGNKNFIVGTDMVNTLTFTEREGGVDYEVNNLAGLSAANASDGDWTGLIQIGTADPGTTTGGLTLQIGDTADSFNKLRVSVSDMHAKALGISDVDITTQAGAAAAIDKIKAAINTVSSVRGDLGATQNRLDHTINNLSVMTENIQDAESSIRDVDVAKEMMAYTKNNILIQSAQAMLAQANQVPQGVLQLMQ